MKLILGNRHFTPFFWVQFLGALNDNVFKNALVILITYRSIEIAGWDKFTLVPLAGGIFILPWLLFSATAGQLGDRYQKTTLIRIIKLVEIAVMILAALGFIFEQFELLMVTLFLMGTQSTFFGPLKYGIIPSLVSRNTLLEANSFVTGGTFVAILLGTILGGTLSYIENGPLVLSVVLIFLSVSGWFLSCWIEKVPVYQNSLKVDWTLLRSTGKILSLTWRKPEIFRILMGISWFWFLGAAVLSLLPLMVQELFRGSEEVTTFFLGIFVLGMGCGAFLVKKISLENINLGLVPLSLLGIGLVLLDLYANLGYWGGVHTLDKTYDLKEFLQFPYVLRIVADIFLLTLFGGVYVISQMTYIQQVTPSEELARIISGNNIWNAIFMILSSFFVAGFSKSLGIVNEIGLLGLGTLVTSVILYCYYSDHVLRSIGWVLIRLIYRVTVKGLHNIPAKGPFILVSNHVSFADGPLLMGACTRPIHFVLDWRYYYFFTGPFWFRQARCIPIATGRESGEVLEKAFQTIYERLDNGEVIGIFPEGKITQDGKINAFQPGVAKIIRKRPVPVVLCGIDGMWGSIFSRKDGLNIWKRRLKGFRTPITFTFSVPISSEEYDSELTREIIKTYVSHAREG